jgi:hypothetical protein
MSISGLTLSGPAKSAAIIQPCSAHLPAHRQPRRVTHSGLVERKSKVHLEVEREQEHEPCVSGETQHLRKKKNPDPT